MILNLNANIKLFIFYRNIFIIILQYKIIYIIYHFSKNFFDFTETISNF
jgi:hypothetical protein